MALAHGASSSSAVSEIDGLAWMDIRDSSGVPLANYQFVTDQGGPLNPGSTVLWSILGLEFIGYLAIVTTAIWLIGYTLGFRWLDMFSTALSGVADGMVRAVASPIVLTTAAAAGALCVAWFVVRGFHAKATRQILMMVVVAIAGPFLLAEPLEDVLSPHGLLAQGRDLGISVAAGLNGDSRPDPAGLVATMQAQLADNFARRPIQVWNFGHVVDDSTACKSAWSAGMVAGNEDQVRQGLRMCGDASAYAKADRPTMGQVGTGLLLLLCGGLLVLFAVYLGTKITKAALDAIYHGFMAIFGLAAGGFIYGPTQTFLVRNMIDSIVATFRMTCFTVFLGAYMLFMGNLFRQSHDQVLSVIIIAGTVELVAISQLHRLSTSLDGANDWMANRFARNLQDVDVTPVGNGRALGMGNSGMGGGHGLGGGLRTMAGITALNAINASPAMAFLMGGRENPLSPRARGRRRKEIDDIASSRMRRDMHEWNQIARTNYLAKGRSRLGGRSRIESAWDVANVLDGLLDNQVPPIFIPGVMYKLGASHDQINDGFHALSVQKATTMVAQHAFPPLQKAVAAARAAAHYRDNPLKSEALAAQAAVAADNFLTHTDENAAKIVHANIDRNFVQRITNVWDDEDAMKGRGPNAVQLTDWEAANQDTLWAIGIEAANRHRAAAHAYRSNTRDKHSYDEFMKSTRRINNLDHEGRDPWD
ncbi:hypothetical protein ACFVMC_29355 [Nocardia sp. NPDC127579]|uniref:hypothetical protein n=1 Tax=Nocardia sp. NPDC127579 TaxID=3345402 RepID=UPI003634B84B